MNAAILAENDAKIGHIFTERLEHHRSLFIFSELAKPLNYSSEVQRSFRRNIEKWKYWFECNMPLLTD